MNEPETLPAPRPLVVIGSSAGGIDALATLLAAVPAHLPAPVVIAQHLDPAGQSHLEAILGRSSAAPVVVSADGMELEPGVVYVIPTNRHAEVAGGAIRLFPGDDARPIPSVDRLMTSAAREAGENVVAIVLTGTGSDGALGAHAVKTAGGTVIVQDPATAAYPSMPRNVPASVVDIAAPVERIGPIVADLLAGGARSPADRPSAVEAVLERVARNRGVDFTDYKTPTVSRRLQRRMVATGTKTPEAYLAYLEEHPEEEAALVGALLIKVTEFFRDPSLYDVLRESILPELIHRAAETGRELRVWSAGCATGEEAYSVAMLLSDLQRDSPHPVPVRIFATDLDAGAIEFGRRGVYSAASLAKVPPAMVERHFVAVDGAYEVAKEIRAVVVFGQHDLGRRPPFPNIDLVLCRNVLIYFDADLQDRVLRSLAYSLNDGGYLVLGRSESTSRLPELFRPAARAARIYQRVGPRPPLAVAELSTPAGPRARPAGHAPAPQRVAAPAQPFAKPGLDDVPLDALPFGIAVVDRRYDILAINLAARRLLGIHGLAIGEDFIHLSQRVPSSSLRAAIDTVARTGESTALDPVATTDTATGEERHIAISCHAGQRANDAPAATVLILVSDATQAVQASRALQEQAASAERLVDANRQILAANQELTTALVDARAANEQYEAEVAGAQANVEEILTLNEELQAANEELETLNEETQATVEELKATNDDLEARGQEIREMTAAQAAERERLANILEAMGDAVAVVGGSGQVLLENRAWRDMLAEHGGTLVPADQDGHPLPEAARPWARVAAGESFTVEYTTSPDGNRRWYEAIGRALHAGGIDGGVLVVRDITDRSLRSLQNAFLAQVSHELRTPLTVMFGSLELALRALPKTPEMADVRELIDTSMAMAEQQARLVDDLVDTSRIASGKLMLDMGAVDLDALVRDRVAQAMLIAPEHAIDYAGPGHPVTVAGDAGRLGQALMVLLRNAASYSPDSLPIEVRLDVRDGQAAISVTDQGIGVPEKEAAHIFEQFGRTEGSRRMNQKGLGLGLFIAQEIAHAHGGAIALQSVPGEGATFVLSLPLDPA